MPDSSNPVTPAANEILGYLMRHPDANDTVKGIVEWWLLEQRIEQSVAQVTAALAELAASGLILANQGADGQVHYRVNRNKQADIMKRLKEASRNRPETE
jgi:Fe2+ or Zn2+ uptake regulation protein